MAVFNQGNVRAGKLTPTLVHDMRLEYAAGATQGSLARKYGISIGQVGRIVRGECWQQYSNPAAESSTPIRQLSPEELSREAQESAARMAQEFGLASEERTISDRKSDMEQDIPPPVQRTGAEPFGGTAAEPSAERQEELLRKLQGDAQRPLDELKNFTEK